MSWELVRDRSVIHLNVADFAVAVERVVDVRLRGRPVLVAAQGAARAAVFDMSDEAYRAGVRKGMALRHARKICRDARVVDPHPTHYERAMAALLKIAGPFSPLIEAEDGNGHLFVDATGTNRLYGPPPDVAWRIRRTAQRDVSLDPIWAVAPNKLVAKVATRVVKPSGEYIVEAGEEEAFLRPLPVHFLPGLERGDLVRLGEFHITRVGQAALWSVDHLQAVFGRRGRTIYRTVRGLDDTPILPLGHKPPAMRFDHEFADDTNDRRVVEGALYRLVEKAGFELRERGRAARLIVVTIDYSDGVRVFRQKSHPGTASDYTLYQTAAEALGPAWFRRVRIRRLRLSCGRLVYPPRQLELFPDENPKPGPPAELLDAVDRVRRRFGEDAVTMGRTRAAA